MTYGRWIGENRATRIPRTHICLDTESLIAETAKGQTHSFRCAVTSVDTLNRDNETWTSAPVAVHDEPMSVWRLVTATAKAKHRTVLVAHNLGFDLRVADAFSCLPALGWSLEHLSLAPGSTWLTWRREGASLSMVDSMTWLPTSLANVGMAIGRAKRSLPQPEDAELNWVQRCVQDVEILRDAWLRIIRFLRDQDCGNWRPTGAGQSWSVWRHKHITHPIFAHDDLEMRTRERRAGWAGRAEAWRFGRQVDGPFTEWDFSCCYAQIARTHEVPTELVGELSNASLARVEKASASMRVLVECEVSTSVPTVPTSCEGRIVWPVGSFATSLWDCELSMALSHGAVVKPARAWVYRRAPALRQWAEWCLERVYAAPGEVDPVVRAVCKHWCRALIGRFGSRFGVWEAFGDGVGDGVGLYGFSDISSGSVGELLSVGGKSWVSMELRDHPLSAPQVMSWINAQARVDLWEAMNAAGLGSVLYVDTDSLIVDRDGDANLRQFGVPGLRPKARYQSLDILGTRRLIEDRELKAAGVSKGARRLSSTSWSAESWDSLQSSLKSGSPDSVRVVPRRVTFRVADGRRVRMTDGSSRPYEITSASA